MFRRITAFCIFYAAAVSSVAAQPVTTVLTIDGSGRSILQIHNASDRAITAIVFTAKLQTISDGTPSEIYRYLDSLSGGWHAIAPHSDGSVTVAGNRATAQVTFRAALLDDNSVSGDATWGARIPQYRKIWNDTVNDLLAKVASAGKNNVPLPDLIAQWQAAATLAGSQHIGGAGAEDWTAEVLRYTNQTVQGINEMAAKQLANSVETSIPPPQALASLSASLRARLR